MATRSDMTLDSIRRRWVGRKIHSSTTPRVDYGRAPAGREITDIHPHAKDGMYYAWSGEHHRANTLEALSARLHQLAGD